MEFIPHWTTLGAYTIAAVVLALTPGPDMTFFLAQSVSNGRRCGFAALAGASTGLIIHSVAIAAGLAALLVAAPVLFNLLKWVGAAYLAWLAFNVLRHGSGMDGLRMTAAKATVRRAYVKALWINLLNPKIIVFFVTFLPQFVSPGDPHAASKLLFLGLWFMVVSVPVLIPLILAADRLALWLKGSKRAMRIFDWLFAGVMGAFAVRLLAARPPV
ncbi:MAG: LysE family translocator [Flavobacteriaceae bacterium]